MQPHDKVTDLALEQFALGELDPAVHARIEAQLQEDAALQARLMALQKSDEALRAAYPTEVITRAVTRRAAFAAKRPAKTMRWAAALAGSLVALMIAPVLWSEFTAAPGLHGDASEDRLKGDNAGFAVEHVTADGQATTLLSGDHGKKGDTLQIALHAPIPAYVAVVSIDGAGHVTQIVPGEGSRAALATTGLGTYLPVTYTLDDAPNFERIFLVGSGAPFDTDDVLGMARSVASHPDVRNLALPLTSTLSQTSILILKD